MPFDLLDPLNGRPVSPGLDMDGVVYSDMGAMGAMGAMGGAVYYGVVEDIQNDES